MINFAINGFGRIGKSVLRALAERPELSTLKCVAINAGEGDLKSHLHMLKYDSTHGILSELEMLNHHSFKCGNNIIEVIFEKDPLKLNWAKLGVDVVLECSGKFTQRDQAAMHLNSGAKKVLVSAPSDGADVTIVYKVNDKVLKPTDNIISIGSCTTNCLAPVAAVLNENLGIISGFMTTIHAYTNDQVLLDSNHKDLRRARSATVSLIPSSTGAAKAIGIVIPELMGKLDGGAIRVPVPNVSMIELFFNSTKSTTVEEINFLIKNASLGSMQGVLGYSDEPLVSIDYKHSPLSSIFDATLTKVIGGNTCKVTAWYDNEWGFSNRMLDVANILKF